MRHVTGKCDRVAGIESDRLVCDPDRDLALVDLQELLGARRVGFTLVLVSWAKGPVLQFHHIRRFGTRDQHATSTALTTP
jgi:hypothetical protein